jgi:8-oxo-dGTP pyrophosphatase MutT (NUDIX family)
MTKRPRAFIASSSEHIEFAEAIQLNLQESTDCTIWNQGAFSLTASFLDGILKNSHNTDFGIFIFAADDVVRIRDRSHNITRDNVVFELGLFVGVLGLERVFIVEEAGDNLLHLPSDLSGLVTIKINTNRDDGNLEAALGPASSRIRKQITQLGPRVTNDSGNPNTQGGQYVAAICFRKLGPFPEFLLVRSTRGRRIFPKGRLNEGESLDVGALRYAYTEGGVFGNPITDSGAVFRYLKEENHKEHMVTAILVECTSTVNPRTPFREPAWFPLEQVENEIYIDREFVYAEELRRVVRWAKSHIKAMFTNKNQSGIIPYRIMDDQFEVLLVTSKTNRRWIFPKGAIRRGSSSKASAIMEALEEAGIEGKTEDQGLGFYEYLNAGVPYSVEYYAMEVQSIHKNWPEMTLRERKWFRIEQAATVVEYEHIKQIIVDLMKKKKLP